jgi:cell division protein FtsB
MSTAGAATPQAAPRRKSTATPGAGGTSATPRKSPRPPGAHAAPPSPRRVRLSPRGALLLVVVMLLLMAAIGPIRNLMGQRGAMSQLQHQSAVLEQQNAALQARVDQLNDPLYLEQLARRCLGMVRPGEIAFVILPKHGIPTSSDC